VNQSFNRSSAEIANAPSLLKVKIGVEKFLWHCLCSWLRKYSISFSWGVSLTPLGNLIFTEINEKHNLKTLQDFCDHNKSLSSTKIPLAQQEPGYIPLLHDTSANIDQNRFKCL